MRKLSVKIDNMTQTVEESLLVFKEEGDVYKNYTSEIVDGKYVVDTVKEQELTKTKVLEDASAVYEEKVKSLTAGTPESEKLTWAKQETEARAWLLDNTVATPLIDGIVSAREVDKAELVSKIIAKADAYATAVGVLTGKRQAVEDAN